MVDRYRDYDRDYEREYGRDYGYGRRYNRDDAYERAESTRGDYGYDQSRYGAGFDYGQGYSPRRYYGEGYGRGYMGDRDYYGSFRQRSYDPNYYGQTYGGYGSRYGRERDYGQDYDYEPATWSYTEYWLIPGPYTGRGPQGYQRQPERIQDDINERLTQHGQIDASNIEVEVDDQGVATLRGEVNSRREKRMAEDTVESVWGVQDVRNELRVAEQRQQQQPDGQRQRQGQQRQGARREQIRQEMTVVGRDGDEIGPVLEVREQDFLINRRGNPDVFVPFSAVQSVSGDRITLNVRKGEVNDQGWESPEKAGKAQKSRG